MTRDDRRVARVELRLTSDELSEWRRLAAEYDQTVADLVREAVRRFADRDATELANLGRTVLAAARRVDDDSERRTKRRKAQRT